MKEVVIIPSLVLVSYGSWDDASGKDETYNEDETNTYTLENDAATGFWDNWIGTSFISYESSGTHISTIDLSAITEVLSASISWTQVLVTGSTITIETSIDNGLNWDTIATSGDSIPSITTGIDLTGVNLLIKETLTTADELITPEVNNDIVVTFESGIVFDNQSDMTIYGEMWIEKSGTASDITITNKTDSDRSFTFTGLTTGETIYISNGDKIIESDVSSVYRYDYFSGDFIRFLKDENEISVDGNCTLQLRYQFKFL